MTITQMAGHLTGNRVRYLPILKSRQGEMRALEELLADQLEDLTPIVELVEVDFDGLSGAETQHQVARLAAKIAKAWRPGRPRIIVDTFHIEVDPEEPVTDSHGETWRPEPITGPLLDMLRQDNVRAVPVIRLSDPEPFGYSIRDRLHTSHDPGACLRIGGEDLDDTVVPLDQAVAALLEFYGLNAEDVDLVLDFGSLADDNMTAMASRLARFVLPSLDRLPWRSFALASGAFPVNLSEVAAYSIAELPRRDRQLWLQLTTLRLRRPLDYSDYAVTHPTLQTGVAFAAPPQIRYSTRDNWLVLKGRRTDRRGHRQFFDLCARLFRDYPESMDPASQSWGDQWIHEAARNDGLDEGASMGPGNASTWRAYATSHHIGHVQQSLRTRGEP